MSTSSILVEAAGLAARAISLVRCRFTRPAPLLGGAGALLMDRSNVPNHRDD
jgi:hypothetical protein